MSKWVLILYMLQVVIWQWIRWSKGSGGALKFSVSRCLLCLCAPQPRIDLFLQSPDVMVALADICKWEQRTLSKFEVRHHVEFAPRWSFAVTSLVCSTFSMSAWSRRRSRPIPLMLIVSLLIQSWTSSVLLIKLSWTCRQSSSKQGVAKEQGTAW